MQTAGFFMMAMAANLSAQNGQLITATQSQSASGQAQLTIQNNTDQPIGAFVYTWAASGVTPIKGFRFYEPALYLAERPIAPRAALALRVGPPRAPVSIQFRAAVFADGSAFGDPVWVARIIHRRQLAVAAADDMLKLLNDDRSNPPASVGDIAAQIESYKAAHISASTDQDVHDAAAYFITWLNHNLKVQEPTLGNVPSIIQRNIVLVADVRTKLAASLASGGH